MSKIEVEEIFQRINSQAGCSTTKKTMLLNVAQRREVCPGEHSTVPVTGVWEFVWRDSVLYCTTHEILPSTVRRMGCGSDTKRCADTERYADSKRCADTKRYADSKRYADTRRYADTKTEPQYRKVEAEKLVKAGMSEYHRQSICTFLVFWPLRSARNSH